MHLQLRLTAQLPAAAALHLVQMLNYHKSEWDVEHAWPAHSTSGGISTQTRVAAVAPCRLYVPVFLPDVDMSPYPNVVKYMQR
jgi:hypothetical protein